jgi:hypothetical protein
MEPEAHWLPRKPVSRTRKLAIQHLVSFRERDPFMRELIMKRYPESPSLATERSFTVRRNLREPKKGFNSQDNVFIYGTENFRLLKITDSLNAWRRRDQWQRIVYRQK